MTKTTYERAPLPTVSPHIPAPLPVFEHRGQLVADSRDVAAMMERNHRTLCAPSVPIAGT